MRTGSRPTLTCNSISRRQAGPGLIRSRYGSRSCKGSRLAAPPSQGPSSFRNTSMPTSTRITTKLSPSSGPGKRSTPPQRPPYHSALIPGASASSNSGQMATEYHATVTILCLSGRAGPRASTPIGRKLAPSCFARNGALCFPYPARRSTSGGKARNIVVPIVDSFPSQTPLPPGTVTRTI